MTSTKVSRARGLMLLHTTYMLELAVITIHGSVLGSYRQFKWYVINILANLALSPFVLVVVTCKPDALNTLKKFSQVDDFYLTL